MALFPENDKSGKSNKVENRRIWKMESILEIRFSGKGDIHGKCHFFMEIDTLWRKTVAFGKTIEMEKNLVTF